MFPLRVKGILHCHLLPLKYKQITEECRHLNLHCMITDKYICNLTKKWLNDIFTESIIVITFSDLMGKDTAKCSMDTDTNICIKCTLVTDTRYLKRNYCYTYRYNILSSKCIFENKYFIYSMGHILMHTHCNLTQNVDMNSVIYI